MTEHGKNRRHRTGENGEAEANGKLMAASESPPESSPEKGGEERGSREAMQQLYGVLGEVMDMMARHEGYAGKALSRAHMDVLPPLALRQYRVTRDEEGALTSYISWAKTSEEVLAALRDGKNLSGPQDWNSGELGVVIDVVSADARTSAQMIGYLKQQEFSDGCLYAMRLLDGKSELTEVGLMPSPDDKAVVSLH